MAVDFELSPEQEAYQLSVRKICALEIAPRVVAIDTDGQIPDALITPLANAGLLAPMVSAEYGGAGVGSMETALAAMEIGRADTSMATAVYFLLNAGWSHVLEKYGSAELKREVLPDVCAGRAFLGVASTEPTGGSDVANIKTYADPSPKGGGYVLIGRKSYISGVTEAQRLGGGSGFLTIAKTTLFGGSKGLGLFYVPVRLPGITIGTIDTMGRSGISTGTLVFDHVELPNQYRLDTGDRGFYYLLDGFNTARIAVAAACIGFAEALLERGIRHVKQRGAFGRPIAKFEGIQFELADLATRLEQAKLLVFKAAWAREKLAGIEAAGPPEDEAAIATMRQLRGTMIRTVAMAKLTAPQVAFDIAKSVMIWHGALGYSKALGLERALRGVMSYVVGAEGALNIMRVIIGRQLLGAEFVPYH